MNQAGGGGVTYRSRLQFGGADGSTTFTDDTGKTWSTFGNAQIDTSLGDQRGLFDGTNSYITTPNHADFDFSGDFKFDFGLRFNSLTGFQTVFSKGYVTPSTGVGLLIQTGNGDGKIVLYTAAGSSILGEPGTINAGQDYAYELYRVGGTIFLKRDGVVVNSVADTRDFSSTGAMSIGGGSSSGYNNFWFNGWIKDWKLT